jgi:hypothetical protein
VIVRTLIAVSLLLLLIPSSAHAWSMHDYTASMEARSVVHRFTYCASRGKFWVPGSKLPPAWITVWPEYHMGPDYPGGLGPDMRGIRIYRGIVPTRGCGQYPLRDRRTLRPGTWYARLEVRIAAWHATWSRWTRWKVVQ